MLGKEKTLTKEESGYIKLLAITTMLIDHIGAFLYPLDILRIIGRISFPLFAYQLTISCKKTSDINAYIKRLFIFAVISQIPYYLLLKDRGSPFLFNILFSLMLGIFAILAIENKKLFYLFLIIPAAFFTDYRIYGLLTILIFYFINKNTEKIFFFSVVTFLYSFIVHYYNQAFALISLLFILGPKLKISIPKYFFYVFYPAHLLIIYIIRIFLF